MAKRSGTSSAAGTFGSGKGMIPRNQEFIQMAIFARLVCLLFSIGLSAGLGGALAESNFSADKPAPIIGGIIGAIVGIFIGGALGKMVAGPPPKN